MRRLLLREGKCDSRDSKLSGKGDSAPESESGPHLRSGRGCCCRVHFHGGSFGRKLGDRARWEEYRVEGSAGRDARRTLCDGH